ncbi:MULTISPECIES: DNA cytosine methyltransferase [unclassified Acidovorax]|uniref:DNA cytosine methyltransferase n=1 Tax=unclassified Acidovorax TaxID=2684926 RepID=UPI001C46A8E4|nr:MULTISPECIES: DNA cytosine methyltransferase [unclassified Acidovorax]MBV7427227.1 DNA cytosine methyltransferase [Acidovorax sp. sif0732]MBV7448351.1 DNA cytosine methyltransferase [Acidovorax sp. sif0715]
MSTYKFVDLFSGCGGLSLGLAMAGLEGQFAVERDAMAFETFSANFLGERKLPVEKFAWPSWLEKRAWPIDELLIQHADQLTSLDGSVEVLAGGPPCQGFSFAGRRNESDPRNQLFEKYVEVVKAIKPSALILENVPGMKVAHSKKRPSAEGGDAPAESYYEKLKRSLEDIDYEVHGELVDASRFGVPQKRTRLIVIGLRKDIAGSLEGGTRQVFKLLEKMRTTYLKDLGLPESVSACDALSDLTTKWHFKQPCVDPYSPRGFEEIVYGEPSSKYQKLMHKGCRKDAMDSMRLARHGDEVRERFARILAECPRGVRMSEANREQYSTKKHRIYPMDPWVPAPTITTLPDDVLHYSEPRILTVRESARLQSFPDWFQFRGKFTTGGDRRTKECPRYTQVGNAVPPLLARAIGLTIRAVLDEAKGAVATRPTVANGESADFEQVTVA